VAPAIRGHMRDLLWAIASRGRPVAEFEEGAISTASCILANLAMKVGRTLTWDPQANQVVGDEANKLLARPYRRPWDHLGRGGRNKAGRRAGTAIPGPPSRRPAVHRSGDAPETGASGTTGRPELSSGFGSPPTGYRIIHDARLCCRVPTRRPSVAGDQTKSVAPCALPWVTPDTVTVKKSPLMSLYWSELPLIPRMPTSPL
jgi:Oxidoreductase family, C-terminal alpha/beta domain